MAHDINSLRAAAHSARSVPGSMGLRRYSVHVVTRSWSGSRIGEGSCGDCSTELLEAGYPPKLREMNAKELAFAGLESATYKLGPITPEYTYNGVTSGIAYETLKPTVYDDTTEFFYVISGGEFGDGMRCTVDEVDHSSPLHYTVTLTPAESVV